MDGIERGEIFGACCIGGHRRALGGLDATHPIRRRVFERKGRAKRAGLEPCSGTRGIWRGRAIRQTDPLRGSLRSPRRRRRSSRERSGPSRRCQWHRFDPIALDDPFEWPKSSPASRTSWAGKHASFSRYLRVEERDFLSSGAVEQSYRLVEPRLGDVECPWRRIGVASREAVQQFPPGCVYQTEDNASAKCARLQSIVVALFPRPKAPIKDDAPAQFKRACCNPPLNSFDWIAERVKLCARHIRMEFVKPLISR